MSLHIEFFICGFVSLGGVSVFSDWLIDWQVSFTLNEELTTIDTIGEKPSMVRAPREHPFTLQTVGGQTLAVFTENSSGEKQDFTKYSLLWIAVLNLELKILTPGFLDKG